MIILIIFALLLFIVNVFLYETREDNYDSLNNGNYLFTLIVLCAVMYFIGYENNTGLTSKKPITPTITVVCKDNVCDTTYNYNQNK